MQIKPSKTKGVKKVNILLDNELTIFSIEEIKDKIVKAFSDHKKIEFTIKNISNMDLSFVQFLYALNISAEKMNKEITYSTDFNDDIRSLFLNSDIYKVFKA